MKRSILVIIITILASSSFSQIYKFKSTNYDIEKPNVAEYKTYYDVTYHTFDYDNLMVTFEGENSNGAQTIIKYPMKSFYKETGLFAETWMIVVDLKGVKEIWFSVQANNLGYDLEDGTRIAYYDLTQLK